MAVQGDDGRWQGTNGQWYNSEGEANTMAGGSVGGGSGGGGGFMSAAVGAMGPLLLIVLIVPIVLAGLFQLVFNLLFKAKIVGRIIQSAIYGLLIGVVLLVGLWTAAPGMAKVFEGNIFLRALAVIIIFGIPTFWYYASHYYTLKALLNDSRFTGDDWGTFFIITFSIPYVGVIVLLIVSTCLNFFEGIKMPSILYVVPFVLGFLYYLKKAFSAREGAGVIKGEIEFQPIGLPIAIVLAFLLPFISISNTANEEKNAIAREKKRNENVEMIKNAIAGGLTAVISDKDAFVVGTPSYDDYDFLNFLPRRKKGTVVTITGEVIIDAQNFYWLPIEYNGQYGYMRMDSVKIQKPIRQNTEPASASRNATTPLQDIVSSSAGWAAFVDGGNSIVKNNTTANITFGKETMQNTVTDVMTLQVNLASGTEWRIGEFTLNNTLIQQFKSANGIRFSVLGDGENGWRVIFPTNETLTDNCFHEAVFSTANGRVTQIDIPFSRLAQPNWGRRVTFNRNNIVSIKIQRHSTDSNYSGSSAIKVFGFETY